MAIEKMIEQVEQLYKLVTGREPAREGERPYSSLPQDKDPETHIEEQLDRLLNTIDLALCPSPLSSAPFIPTITIWRRSSDYLICVDLPGVEVDKLSLSLTDHKLLVIGDRAPPEGVAGSALYWEESRVGSFMRVTVLPSDIAVDKMMAQLKNGVLEIVAPRLEASPLPPNGAPTSRRIDVRASQS